MYMKRFRFGEGGDFQRLGISDANKGSLRVVKQVPSPGGWLA